MHDIVIRRIQKRPYNHIQQNRIAARAIVYSFLFRLPDARCTMHTAAHVIGWLCLVRAASALASVSRDWEVFPGGRMLHSSCVQRGDAASAEPLMPCKHIRPLAEHPSGSGYYGGWSVYSFLPANRTLAHMSATFKVPPKPSSLGPLGLSSLYMCPPPPRVASAAALILTHWQIPRA